MGDFELAISGGIWVAAGALVPKHTLIDETVDEGGLLAEIGQDPAYAMESLSVETIKLVEKQLARLPGHRGVFRNCSK
jgi:hypothetical protein